MNGTSPIPNALRLEESDFKYFAEIEQCFQSARGTPTLVSPLDWALIESWKEAGVPVEAVRAGVARAFEKFKKRRRAFRKINSLAYCAQEVLHAAGEFQGARASAKPAAGARRDGSPFDPPVVKAYMASNLKAVEEAERAARTRNQDVLAGELAEVAQTLREVEAGIAPQALVDFQDVETRLTALEEKLTASFTRAVPADALDEIQREIERGLASARRRMTIPQIESLSRQFMKRRLFEYYRVPRLSLFYM